MFFGGLLFRVLNGFCAGAGVSCVTGLARPKSYTEQGRL